MFEIYFKKFCIMSTNSIFFLYKTTKFQTLRIESSFCNFEYENSEPFHLYCES